MSLNIVQGGINLPVINVDMVVTVAGNGHAANAVKAGDPVLCGNIPGVAEVDYNLNGDGLTPVNTSCIARLSVVGVGSSGNAHGTLTSDNTNVSDGDTVTIAGKVYTFKTILGTTDGNVLIGADADASLTNLAAAINHTGTPGTDYVGTSKHPFVSASVVAAHAITVTAKRAGTNETVIDTTETSAHLSWGAATLVMSAANAAISAGDKLYMQTDGTINKDSGATGAVAFGTAFGNDDSASAVGTDIRTGQLVVSGATTTIRVWVGKIN